MNLMMKTIARGRRLDLNTVVVSNYDLRVQKQKNVSGQKEHLKHIITETY